MNFELSEEQEMMRETFARFLDGESSMARVRVAQAAGFDRALWSGLAELGAFSIRVPEEQGGLGLGLLDAAVLMEEAGRTLASAPVAEGLVAARLLATLGGESGDLLGKLLAGHAVVSIALRDVAVEPRQWVAGGAVADAVIARDGDRVVLVTPKAGEKINEDNLASTAIAELDLGAAPRVVLSSDAAGGEVFAQAVEEWKLLIAAGLAGLSREALRLAAAYASERKQFDQLIGTFQAISHPLADLLCEVDGGKYLVWKAIRDIADGVPEAAANLSLATWWNIDTAGRAVAQALHTFGGYGLTTEYDIHLYNLRAKGWPLVLGDPRRLMEEAGRRLYAGETAALPDVGPVTIDFDLGAEARALADEIDAFFTKTLTPELRAKAHYSWEGHDPGFHKQLAEAKLLFYGLPAEMGTRAVPPYARHAAADVWEKHGWTTFAANVTQLVAIIIHRFGSDEAKRDILSRILAGEAICSLGYSEPASGSDVFAAQCKATREGDGWRINGTKMFTSGADIADYVLMLTRTNPDVPKHKGLTMFIVPLKSKGIAIQPVHTFQGERTNITFYDNVHVPDAYRLGPVDGGVRAMSAGLELEHGGSFSKPLRAMLKAAEAFCREIQRDGHPLIEETHAQMRLARTAADLAVSDLLGFRALWASVEKKPNLAFGPMAKMYSSERFLADARDLLDLTAPYSLSKRTGPAGFLNQCYRHAQGTTIYGGTSEIHRSMIAERALGMPRTRA
ncbi:MAG TPA: acyl-CoA dehydrogenase [Nevskiaceae bacterium]|nr:acyl-CoA dehydrogenase [Nevskiaceae bacterium]